MLDNWSQQILEFWKYYESWVDGLWAEISKFGGLTYFRKNNWHHISEVVNITIGLRNQRGV
jgi:hypothetical protein